MTERHHHPHGVPCWIDLIQDDPEAAMTFYRDLFGWNFEIRTSTDSPVVYAHARLDGDLVAAVGGPPGPNDPAGWVQYVSVGSADDIATEIENAGGKVIAGPEDIPGAGRVVHCADPEGARFGLWQPAELEGIEAANVGGAWNFSELNSADLEGAAAFYAAVFGWEVGSFGIPGDPSGFFRMPGYGAVLAQRDPAAREFQESGVGPEGFGDAVTIIRPLAGDAPDPAPHWSTTFAVADADAAFARAVALGARPVVTPFDTAYTRQSTVRDPQGAVLTLSEYRPGNT